MFLRLSDCRKLQKHVKNKGLYLLFSENKSSLKLPYYLITGGEGGIRTRDTELPYTRFPGVLLQPLGHLTAPEHPTVVVVWNGAHYIENLAQCKLLRKLFTKSP